MKYIIPIVIGILLVGLITVFAIPGIPMEEQPDNELIYNSRVDISTTGDFEGRESPAHQGELELIQSSENTLYSVSKEALENILAVSANRYLNLSLCNATDPNVCEIPVAAGTESWYDFLGTGATHGCGLGNASGLYYSLGTGNWTVENTFTASCDGIYVNATRLQNGTHDIFAGESFTHTSLDDTDTLHINWSVWIS